MMDSDGVYSKIRRAVVGLDPHYRIAKILFRKDNQTKTRKFSNIHQLVQEVSIDAAQVEGALYAMRLCKIVEIRGFPSSVIYTQFEKMRKKKAKEEEIAKAAARIYGVEQDLAMAAAEMKSSRVGMPLYLATEEAGHFIEAYETLRESLEHFELFREAGSRPRINIQKNESDLDDD